MAHLVRVAMLIPVNQSYHRGIAAGVARYAEDKPSWVFSTQFQPGVDFPEILDWEPDGILANVRRERVARAMAERGVAAVNVSGTLADAPLPQVIPDPRAAGRLGAEHLLNLGLERFAYCGFPGFGFSDRRGAGYAGRVEEAGFEVSAYEPDPAIRLDWSWDGAQQDIARWLEGLARPVGVMACNDTRAVSVLEACRRIGAKVPQDVAILGVDDDDLLCRMARPTLSSVALPLDEVGHEGAAVLDRLMSGEAPPEGPILLPPTGITTRASTQRA